MAIASRLHWPLDDILDLQHPDRARVLTEIDRLEAWDRDAIATT